MIIFRRKKKKDQIPLSQVLKAFLKQTDTRRILTKKSVSHLSKNVLASAKSQSINTQRIKFLKMLYPAINILLTTIIWQWSTTDLTSWASVSWWWPQCCREKTATLSSLAMRQSERLEATSHKPHSKWHSLEEKTNKNQTQQEQQPQKNVQGNPRAKSALHSALGLLEVARCLKAQSMSYNDFTPSPLDGYPPNSDFIIS